MARRSVSLVTCLAVAALVGCASEDDSPAPSARLRHWPSQAPQLPPPDPSAYASASRRPASPAATRRRDTASSPDASTRAPARARDPAGAPSDAEVARELREALGAGDGTSTRALVDRA